MEKELKDAVIKMLKELDKQKDAAFMKGDKKEHHRLYWIREMLMDVFQIYDY